MSEQVILSAIPLDELKADLLQVIQEGIRNSFQQLKSEEKLLSIKEAVKVFVPAISRVTLYNWTRQGLLIKHTISGRTYYKQSEIINAAKSFKKYQQKPDLSNLSTLNNSK